MIGIARKCVRYILGRGSVLDRHRFCVAAEFDVCLLAESLQAFCIMLIACTSRGPSRSPFIDNSSSCTTVL